MGGVVGSAVSLLASASISALAWAQPEAQPQPSLAQGESLIERVVVRGPQMDRVLPDAMGARIYAGKKTTNVNLDELPPLATGQLREAFALIPGLLVSEVSNRSWSSINYRGLGEPHESWNTLVLKDGIPVSPDPYNYPAAYYAPPLDAVARIEFVRGGASLLYGPQPGGTVNYVVRRAPMDGAGLSASATLGADAFSNLYAGGFAGDGAHSVQGYVSRIEGDGPRRTNSDFLTRGAYLNARHMSGAWTFGAGFDLYEGRFGEPGGLSLARYVADAEDASTPFDRVAIDRVVGFLTAAYEEGSWLVEGRLHATYYDRASRRQAGGAFGALTPAANVSVVQSQKFRNVTLDLRARHDFEAFGGSHTTTFGTTLFASDSPVTVDKGVSSTDWDGLAGAVARTERESQVAAFFGEVALDFGRWTVTPGLRAEHLTQEVSEILELGVGSSVGGAPGAPLGPLEQRSNREWIVLPGLGLSYDLADTHEAYANVTRGFKPLLFNDGLTFQSGVNAAAVFESGYAWSYEAGVRGAFGDVLSYDVSAFFIRLENQIGFLAGPLPAAPPFGAVGAGGARRQNVGTMENQGVDLAAELSLTALAGGQDAAADVLLFANASLLDAEFTDGPASGFTPQYAPELMLRSGLIARFDGVAEIAFTGSYLSEHNGSDNGAAEFRIPAYAVFDLTGEWSVTDNLSLFGAVNNVFDRAYFARVRPGGGQGIDPGAGRTVSGGLRVTF